MWVLILLSYFFKGKAEETRRTKRSFTFVPSTSPSVTPSLALLLAPFESIPQLNFSKNHLLDYRKENTGLIISAWCPYKLIEVPKNTCSRWEWIIMAWWLDWYCWWMDVKDHGRRARWWKGKRPTLNNLEEQHARCGFWDFPNRLTTVK